LSEATPDSLKTNFISSQSPSYFANLYREHNLTGGHVIKLGPGNDAAAEEALKTWPGGLHIGGGITDENAQSWLDLGAEKVIVTSYLFPQAKFSLERLQKLVAAIGKDRLVIDLSCRKKDGGWFVAMNKWQDITDLEITQESIHMLSQYCSEFLIHAADVEGLCQGIDEDLVSRLGQWVNIPTTYAGGAKDITDLDLVDLLSGGRVDLTYGSALDIFGGTRVKFVDLVRH